MGNQQKKYVEDVSEIFRGKGEYAFKFIDVIEGQTIRDALVMAHALAALDTVSNENESFESTLSAGGYHLQLKVELTAIPVHHASATTLDASKLVTELRKIVDAVRTTAER